jgi:hypothetical protein
MKKIGLVKKPISPNFSFCEKKNSSSWMKKNWTCEETPKSKFLLLVRKRIHPNG